MKPILIALLMCAWVMGCGGGGGSGSDASNGNLSEAERAQAFLDEAIHLATQDFAVVTCRTIMCLIADGEGENERDDRTVGHGCNWNCLESSIDDSGETRNYVIWLRWERLPDGCFEPPDALIVTENPDLCVPNQERF